MENIDKKMRWKEKEHDYLDKLEDLAEIEYSECSNEENAHYAMSQLLKYGTCEDVAHGIRLYFGYLHCKEEISDLN